MISLGPRPADFDQVVHRRQEAWLLGNAQKDRLLQSGAKHLPIRVVAHETPHIVPLPYLGQLPVVVLAVPEGDHRNFHCSRFGLASPAGSGLLVEVSIDTFTWSTLCLVLIGVCVGLGWSLLAWLRGII